MASRTRFTSSSTPPVSGGDYLDDMDGHLTTMYGALPLEITLTGTPTDDLVGTLDPPLNVGLVTGMSFWLTANATNTGAMTVAIDGEAAVDITTIDGTGLSAGQVENGSRYLLSYDGTRCRIVGTQSQQTSFNEYELFTSNDTLTKPDGFPDNGLVVIEAWGAGGGGGRQGFNNDEDGGAGGAYTVQHYRGADLGASETITIGTAGTGGVNSGDNGTDGTDTTVGSLVRAEGGAGGSGTLRTSDASAAVGTEKGGWSDNINTMNAGASGGSHLETGGPQAGALSLGKGGDGGDSGSPGADGTAPGGGGGAGDGGAGGTGARGEVRVYWIA